MLKRNGVYGSAEVFIRCKEKGYTRSFASMCRQVRKKGYRKPAINKKSYCKYKHMEGKYPGDKFQIDIKYMPSECIKFPSYGNRYYQPCKYLHELEKRMDFPIRMIQVDNGSEFVNDGDMTERESAFEKAAKALNMELRRTRPYSPWQNGKVERSHREDGKILYGRKVFTSEKDLRKQVSKHEARYNEKAKTVLNFMSPDQVVSEYLSKCNICVDN